MNQLMQGRTQKIVDFKRVSAKSTNSFGRAICCGMKNYYVVEWSPSQQGFHLQTLEEMIRVNLRGFRGGPMADYLCIGFFETYEQASNYISKLQGMLAAESEGK